jgi:multimeric flavodoxin WrbA
MKTLLVVYHSRTGGTEQMAKAAVAGAAQEGGVDAGVNASVNVRLVPAAAAGPDDVLAADGYIFATPENLAAMAGVMKDFFDRTYYPVLDRVNGRPYAMLVCAGSDGANAVRQIARIVTGWRLRAVAEPIIVNTHAQTPEAITAAKVIGESDLARCRDLGAALASGLAMGIF